MQGGKGNRGLTRYRHRGRCAMREKQRRLTPAFTVGNDGALGHLNRRRRGEIDERAIVRFVRWNEDYIGRHHIPLPWNNELALRCQQVWPGVIKRDLAPAVHCHIEHSVIPTDPLPELCLVEYRTHHSWKRNIALVQPSAANDSPPICRYCVGCHACLNYWGRAGMQKRCRVCHDGRDRPIYRRGDRAWIRGQRDHKIDGTAGRYNCTCRRG